SRIVLITHGPDEFRSVQLRICDLDAMGVEPSSASLVTRFGCFGFGTAFNSTNGSPSCIITTFSPAVYQFGQPVLGFADAVCAHHANIASGGRNCRGWGRVGWGIVSSTTAPAAARDRSCFAPAAPAVAAAARRARQAPARSRPTLRERPAAPRPPSRRGP